MSIKAIFGGAVVFGVLVLSYYIGWENAFAISFLVIGLTALFIAETRRAARY